MMEAKRKCPPMPKGWMKKETCIECGREERVNPDAGQKTGWDDEKGKFVVLGYICSDCMMKSMTGTAGIRYTR